MCLAMASERGLCRITGGGKVMSDSPVLERGSAVVSSHEMKHINVMII